MLEKQGQSNKNDKNGFNLASMDIHRKTRKQKPLQKITSNTIDIISFFVFPLAYAIFNVAYWSSLNDSSK